MRVGIFARTFPEIGADAVLSAVRAAGYDCTQFNMTCLGLPPMPDAIDEKALDAIAAASQKRGVEIAAVSGTYNMVHPDPAVRARGLARLKTMIGSASRMGTRLVTLCTGTRDPVDQWRYHSDNSSAETWRDLLVEMERALEYAEAHDVDLGIEPELGNVVASSEAALRLLKTIGSPRLVIVLDPANLFETASEQDRRDIVERAVGTLAGRIAMAHAKDRGPDGSYAAAGQGVIDFGHFVRRLRQAGFDGPLVAHGLSANEAPAVAAFLARTLVEAGL
jgi:sugar phosphate isomerase/epimerase